MEINFFYVRFKQMWDGEIWKKVRNFLHIYISKREIIEITKCYLKTINVEY